MNIIEHKNSSGWPKEYYPTVWVRVYSGYVLWFILIFESDYLPWDNFDVCHCSSRDQFWFFMIVSCFSFCTLHPYHLLAELVLKSLYMVWHLN